GRGGRMRDYSEGALRAREGLRGRRPGSPGRQRLWDAMRAVPAGTTITYTELAARAGQPRAPRAAGAACAANLIAPVVPCHRILRSDGSLGGYYYGLSWKEWLLAHQRAHLLVPPPRPAFRPPTPAPPRPPRSPAPAPAPRARPRPALPPPAGAHPHSVQLRPHPARADVVSGGAGRAGMTGH